MKTLIIDGQMWQTNAYFRGMGGYAFGLLSTLVATDENIKLHVVLNERMIHDESRINGIQSWLPNAEIHVIDLPFEPKPQAGEEELAVEALDVLIEGLGVQESETYYFIPALFLFQYCAVFPTRVRKVLLFHDLMPLIYREELGKYFPAHIYYPRFKTIFEADLVVTNSQTTAADLLAHTGLDEKRVVNIDGSLNERLVHDDSIAQDARDILDRLHLRNKRYVIMPTGGLENKNNIRATEAFRAVCDAGDTETQLVVTSFFDDQAKKELRLIAGDRIIFSGNIDGEDLLVLYQHSVAVLMPSLYEGLGLPMLEGIAHDKPVACSDISVFRELPKFEESLYVFDPFDVESIAAALDGAIRAKGFAAKRSHYPEILKKYSWDRSADLFGKALKGDYFQQETLRPSKKLAILCPDPRKNNDVAMFAQRMYAYAKRQGYEPVYFIDPGGDDEVGVTEFPDYVRSLALCYDIDRVYEDVRNGSYDAVLHFIKADSRFTKLLRAAMSIPGYVYISDNGYAPLVHALAENGMISAPQAEAEGKISERAHDQKTFDAVSAIVSAKGLIVERQSSKLVDRTLKTFGLKLPALEVVKSNNVNEGDRVYAKQDKAYQEILAFIGGKN